MCVQPFRKALPLILLIALLTVDACSRATAEDKVQVNWEPDNFFVVCQEDKPCLLDRQESEKVARLMSEAVDAMKKLPFKAPRDWGKRIGRGTINDYIELYQRGTDVLAAASPDCGSPTDYARMLVGAAIRDPYFAGKDYLVFYFMAHEVVHLIQYGYPFFDEVLCKTAVPGWILESIATAVGLEAMRKKYPGVAPSKRDDREARMFSGLRRYDKPLPDRKLVPKDEPTKYERQEELWSGDYDQYYTASFWRHIANAHHHGRYDFLSKYMNRGGRIGDWMPWLRNNIEDDLATDLGIIFTGFLADYAGWGDPGFPGLYFGRRTWLKEAFGGCEQVYLDKNNPSGHVDLKVLPLSGKCIEVRVSTLGKGGLKEGESAAIQAAAVITDGPLSDRDGLHLALAASNDKKEFLCAREVKRHRKLGLGRCILVPDDGKIHLDGGEKEARVWNVAAQETASNPVRRQERSDGRAGELINVYTVSYTPLDLSTRDTIYGGRDPLSTRLYFILDVTTMEVDGHGATTGPAKKRTTASLQPARASDPQTTLPKQDSNGQPANSFALPASLRPALPAAPAPPSAEYIGKLSTLVVTQGAWDGSGTGADTTTLVLTPVVRNGENYDPHPLSIGETGGVTVGLQGNLGGQPLVGVGVGTLQVAEFTDLVFRGRFQGTVCRSANMKPNVGCGSPLPVAGDIVKAFAGSRLPGYYMRIEDTPGVALYRQATEQGMSTFTSYTPGSPTVGSGSAPQPGNSNGTTHSLSDCACTCEERDTTNEAAEQLKARREAGEEVSVGEIMGLTRCASRCQREYMVCEMQKTERERAAAKKSASEAPANCDCGCDGLDRIQRESAALQAQVQAGQAMPLQALEQLGRCMSVCQGEYARCLTR